MEIQNLIVPMKTQEMSPKERVKNLENQQGEKTPKFNGILEQLAKTNTETPKNKEEELDYSLLLGATVAGQDLKQELKGYEPKGFHFLGSEAGLGNSNLTEKGISSETKLIENSNQQLIAFTNSAGPNLNAIPLTHLNGEVNSELQSGSKISSLTGMNQFDGLNSMSEKSFMEMPINGLPTNNLIGGQSTQEFAKLNGVGDIDSHLMQLKNSMQGTYQEGGYTELNALNQNQQGALIQKKTPEILAGSDYLTTRSQVKVNSGDSQLFSKGEGALNSENLNSQASMQMNSLSVNDLSRTQKLSQGVKTKADQREMLPLNSQSSSLKFKSDKLKNSEADSNLGRSEELSGSLAVRQQDQQSTSVVRSEVSGSVVQGSMAKNRLSSDSLNQIGTQIHLLKSQGNRGEIRIRMNPESLGEVTLKVMTNGSQVGLQIQASDENSKRILEESIGSLKESLASKQLSLANVDFSIATQNSSQQQFQNQQETHSQSQYLNQNQSNSANPEQFSNQYQEARSGETRELNVSKPKISRYSGGGAVPVSRGQNLAAGRVDVVA